MYPIFLRIYKYEFHYIIEFNWILQTGLPIVRQHRLNQMLVCIC
jgi:hypothetical protein